MYLIIDALTLLVTQEKNFGYVVSGSYSEHLLTESSLRDEKHASDGAFQVCKLLHPFSTSLFPFYLF